MPIIHQCTGTLDYMGLNGRLVIPPLTDKIYLTLSRALPCWYWKDEAPIRGFGPAVGDHQWWREHGLQGMKDNRLFGRGGGLSTCM